LKWAGRMRDRRVGREHVVSGNGAAFSSSLLWTVVWFLAADRHFMWERSPGLTVNESMKLRLMADIEIRHAHLSSTVSTLVETKVPGDDPLEVDSVKDSDIL
jgi:hypothetical protein